MKGFRDLDTGESPVSRRNPGGVPSQLDPRRRAGNWWHGRSWGERVGGLLDVTTAWVAVVMFLPQVLRERQRRRRAKRR